MKSRKSHPFKNIWEALYSLNTSLSF